MTVPEKGISGRIFLSDLNRIEPVIKSLTVLESSNVLDMSYLSKQTRVSEKERKMSSDAKLVKVFSKPNVSLKERKNLSLGWLCEPSIVKSGDKLFNVISKISVPESVKIHCNLSTNLIEQLPIAQLSQASHETVNVSSVLPDGILTVLNHISCEGHDQDTSMSVIMSLCDVTYDCSDENTEAFDVNNQILDLPNSLSMRVSDCIELTPANVESANMHEIGYSMPKGLSESAVFSISSDIQPNFDYSTLHTEPLCLPDSASVDATTKVSNSSLLTAPYNVLTTMCDRARVPSCSARLPSGTSVQNGELLSHMQSTEISKSTISTTVSASSCITDSTSLSNSQNNGGENLSSNASPRFIETVHDDSSISSSKDAKIIKRQRIKPFPTVKQKPKIRRAFEDDVEKCKHWDEKFLKKIHLRPKRQLRLPKYLDNMHLYESNYVWDGTSIYRTYSADVSNNDSESTTLECISPLSPELMDLCCIPDKDDEVVPLPKNLKIKKGCKSCKQTAKGVNEGKGICICSNSTMVKLAVSDARNNKSTAVKNKQFYEYSKSDKQLANFGADIKLRLNFEEFSEQIKTAKTINEQDRSVTSDALAVTGKIGENVSRDKKSELVSDVSDDSVIWISSDENVAETFACVRTSTNIKFDAAESTAAVLSHVLKEQRANDRLQSKSSVSLNRRMTSNFRLLHQLVRRPTVCLGQVQPLVENESNGKVIQLNNAEGVKRRIIDTGKEISSKKRIRVCRNTLTLSSVNREKCETVKTVVTKVTSSWANKLNCVGGSLRPIKVNLVNRKDVLEMNTEAEDEQDNLSPLMQKKRKGVKRLVKLRIVPLKNLAKRNKVEPHEDVPVCLSGSDTDLDNVKWQSLLTENSAWDNIEPMSLRPDFPVLHFSPSRNDTANIVPSTRPTCDEGKKSLCLKSPINEEAYESDGISRYEDALASELLVQDTNDLFDIINNMDYIDEFLALNNCRSGNVHEILSNMQLSDENRIGSNVSIPTVNVLPSSESILSASLPAANVVQSILNEDLSSFSGFQIRLVSNSTPRESPQEFKSLSGSTFVAELTEDTPEKPTNFSNAAPEMCQNNKTPKTYQPKFLAGDFKKKRKKLTFLPRLSKSVGEISSCAAQSSTSDKEVVPSHNYLSFPIHSLSSLQTKCMVQPKPNEFTSSDVGKNCSSSVQDTNQLDADWKSSMSLSGDGRAEPQPLISPLFVSSRSNPVTISALSISNTLNGSKDSLTWMYSSAVDVPTCSGSLLGVSQIPTLSFNSRRVDFNNAGRENEITSYNTSDHSCFEVQKLSKLEFCAYPSTHLPSTSYSTTYSGSVAADIFHYPSSLFPRNWESVAVNTGHFVYPPVIYQSEPVSSSVDIHPVGGYYHQRNSNYALPSQNVFDPFSNYPVPQTTCSVPVYLAGSRRSLNHGMSSCCTSAQCKKSKLRYHGDQHLNRESNESVIDCKNICGGQYVSAQGNAQHYSSRVRYGNPTGQFSEDERAMAQRTNMCNAHSNHLSSSCHGVYCPVVSLPPTLNSPQVCSTPSIHHYIRDVSLSLSSNVRDFSYPQSLRDFQMSSHFYGMNSQYSGSMMNEGNSGPSKSGCKSYPDLLDQHPGNIHPLWGGGMMNAGNYCSNYWRIGGPSFISNGVAYRVPYELRSKTNPHNVYRNLSSTEAAPSWAPSSSINSNLFVTCAITSSIDNPRQISSAPQCTHNDFASIGVPFSRAYNSADFIGRRRCVSESTMPYNNSQHLYAQTLSSVPYSRALFESQKHGLASDYHSNTIPTYPAAMRFIQSSTEQMQYTMRDQLLANAAYPNFRVAATVRHTRPEFNFGSYHSMHNSNYPFATIHSGNQLGFVAYTAYNTNYGHRGTTFL